MKILFNPWVISIVSAVISALVLYYVFGIGKSEPTASTNAPYSISTVGQIGNNSINQVANYGIVRQNLVNDGSNIRADFSFQADSPILPARACLNVNSDKGISELKLKPPSYSNVDSNFIPLSKEFNYCTNFPANVVVSLYFSEKPELLQVKISNL